MQNVNTQDFYGDNPPPKVASILARLGDEKFFATIGARTFWYDENEVSFTLSPSCPKHVRLVTIRIENLGSYKIDCFGWIKPGTLSAPRAGSANVHPGENLAAAFGELTGITCSARHAVH
jgi:hypothetical protein